MSDTVKLIIEIPKETYKKITADKYAIYDKMYYSIKNGIPLDDVKAEIETNLSWEMFDEYGNGTRLHKSLMDILDSVGKESEE